MRKIIQQTLFFCLSITTILTGKHPLGYDVDAALEQLEALLTSEEAINVNCQDELGLTPLHLIATGRLDRAVKLLKGNPTFYKTTKIKLNHLKSVNCDNWISPIEDTLLFDYYKQGGYAFTLSKTQRSKHIASWEASPGDHIWLVGKLEEAAKLLVAQGADVDAQTLEGANTPLHLAVQQPGFDGLVEVLLDADADTNQPNHLGFTPLHLATLGRELVMVSDLLEAETLLTAISCSGHTALHLTSAHPNILLGLEGKTVKNLKEDHSNAQYTRDTLLAHPDGQDLECHFHSSQRESILIYYETPETQTYTDWLLAALEGGWNTLTWINESAYYIPGATAMGLVLFSLQYLEHLQDARDAAARQQPRRILRAIVALTPQQLLNIIQAQRGQVVPNPGSQAAAAA